MTESVTSSPATVTAPASDTNFAVETHDDGANRIVFVRHGQTDYNVERRFQGVIDRPLNTCGRKQAERAGEVLAKRVLSRSAQVGVSVASQTSNKVVIVCSPLSRASETAELMAGVFRAQGGDVEGPIVDERLIERNYGLFEGLTLPEAREKYPDLVDAWRQTGESGEASIEPSDVVGARVRDATFEAARQAPSDATVIVVAHGAAILRGLITCMGLNPLEFDAMRGLDNCHWSELVRVGGGGSGASGAPSFRLAAHNIGYREDVLGA